MNKVFFISAFYNYAQLGKALNSVFYGEGAVGVHNMQKDIHRICVDFIVVGPVDHDAKKVTGKLAFRVSMCLDRAVYVGRKVTTNSSMITLGRFLGYTVCKRACK